jgi:hypothetical protein
MEFTEMAHAVHKRLDRHTVMDDGEKIQCKMLHRIFKAFAEMLTKTAYLQSISLWQIGSI